MCFLVNPTTKEINIFIIGFWKATKMSPLVFMSVSELLSLSHKESPAAKDIVCWNSDKRGIGVVEFPKFLNHLLVLFKIFKKSEQIFDDPIESAGWTKKEQKTKFI